jgi:hypothetical protein
MQKLDGAEEWSEVSFRVNEADMVAASCESYRLPLGLQDHNIAPARSGGSDPQRQQNVVKPDLNTPSGRRLGYN